MSHDDDHDHEHDHDHPPPPELPEAEANGFGVTSTTNGNQSGAGFQSLSNGNFVISFLSNSSADDGQDIRARFFRLDGSPVGPDIRVNETTAGTQTGISSLALNDGSVLITWRSPDPLIEGNSHLFGRRFSADGVALTGEVQLSASGADGSYVFSQRGTTATNSNALYVAYQNDGEIIGRTFNHLTLAPQTGEVQLNTTLTGTPANIGLQTLSNGNYLLRFDSPEGGANGTEIRNRVFSTDANGAWNAVNINSSPADYLVNTTSSGDQTGIRSNRLANGQVLEVWQSTDAGDGSGTTIRARYLSSTGTPSGTDFVFNTTVTDNQRSPSILGFNDGRRLVWWHSFENGSTDTIRGRWVDHDGTLGAGDFVITTLADTSVPGFTLALLADQSVIALYGGTDAGDGSDGGIQAARVMSLGASLFPAPGTPNELTLPPVLASPFDDPLPEHDWATAAAQISRSITPETPRFTNGLGNSLAMTFAFRDSEDGRPAMTTGASGFGRLNDDQIAAALYAIQQWQDVANITLTRVVGLGSQYSNNAQFTLWNYTSATSNSGPASASGYGGSTNFSGVWQNYVYLNAAKTLATAPTNANGGLEFYMHEVGHALGLSHPGPYNIGGSGTYTAYARDAIFYEDSEQYSLMSYFNGNATHAFLGSASAATPLLYDIAAIQRLYGANVNTRTGNDVYGFNANAGQAFSVTGSDQQIVFAVWDAGGRDVFDFSGYDETQWINLNEEAFSSVGGLRNNISIARNVTIEDAYGGLGADSILGSDVSNLLRGNAGADTLDGGAGADVLEGGLGNDLYLGITGADQVNESQGGGADTLIAATSLFLAANIEVAIIAPGVTDISLTGGAANEMIIGNSGANFLFGEAGDDTLNGIAGDDEIYGQDGNDHLVSSKGALLLDGGAGDDVILVGNANLADIMALFNPP